MVSAVSATQCTAPLLLLPTSPLTHTTLQAAALLSRESAPSLLALTTRHSWGPLEPDQHSPKPPQTLSCVDPF
jgi:hypothetical protein